MMKFMETIITTTKHLWKRVSGYEIRVENRKTKEESIKRIEELQRLCVVDVKANLELYKTYLSAGDDEESAKYFLGELVKALTETVEFANANETYSALFNLRNP